MAASRSGSHLAPSSKGTHSSRKAADIRKNTSSSNRVNEKAFSSHNGNYERQQSQKDGFSRYNKSLLQSNIYSNEFSILNDKKRNADITGLENNSDLSETNRSIEKGISKKENKGYRGKRLISFLICVITFFTVACIGGLGTMVIVTHGPSEQAKKIFVRTFNDTGTKKWIPHLFYSDEEYDRLVHVDEDETSSYRYTYEKESVAAEVSVQEATDSVEAVEYFDITGSTWKGKMLIVHDPSRVVFATPLDAKETNYTRSYTVADYVEMYGAIAGINATGFNLKNGLPYGYVVNNGEFLYKCPESYCYEIVAFDNDNIMHVDWMYMDEVEEAGYRSVGCWGPILIKNGEKQLNLGGGFSARSVIGQRADGSILLVVIEGRMVSSIGATYDDLADLMEEYGAVNAINLDSGRSSVMVYDGEEVTKIAIGSGIQTEDRTIPNAFVVMPEGWEG